MGKLTERELTRLSFLMASLVATPALAPKLFGRVRTGPESLDAVVAELRRLVLQATGTAVTTKETLRIVAGQLLASHTADEKTAGRLLAAALEPAHAQQTSR
jgi:hypothetical protein